MTWSEHNNLIYEGQNGFRKGRSTIDHISSLTQIIETRKKLKMSTFCAFIDFKKAYDSINRDISWHKLEHFKLNNKLLSAIKSIYNNVLCSVKLNGFMTDWFGVKSGLKQGCSLSPVLFNLYINDLALKINALGKGIKIDDESVSILLYADDVVLLAENETDLQCMLNVWVIGETLISCLSIRVNQILSTSGIPQKQNPTSPSKSLMKLSNMPPTTNIWF